MRSRELEISDPKEWETSIYGYKGVEIKKNFIAWHIEKHADHSGLQILKQDYDDFIENGAAVHDVPYGVLNELYDLLNVPKKKRKYPA